MSNDIRLPTHAEAIDRKLDHLAEMIGDVQETVDRTSPDLAALRIAVRDGIVAAASDREVWRIALETLVPIAREHAQAEAGGWMLGGLKVMASRLAWIALIGMAIYLVGGWSALVAFFKHGTPP